MSIWETYLEGDRLISFLKFIKEREVIRIKKEVDKLPPPWTKDPILQTYRFCNVHREDDRVTRWIKANWRDPHYDDPYLWFAMLVARLINWPPTLGKIGYPIPWKPERIAEILKTLKRSGNKVYGSACNAVGTHGVNNDKWAYLEKEVLTPIWSNRKILKPVEGQTLEQFHTSLLPYHGMGSVIVAQVVADIKYVEPLKCAEDWWTFAASGPGSRRGLNRLLDRPVNSNWKENEWKREINNLQVRVNKILKSTVVGKLHAQDVQNCLCEFDKYVRTLTGHSTPRQKYISEWRF